MYLHILKMIDIVIEYINGGIVMENAHLKKFRTKAIHAGVRTDEEFSPLNPPIYQTSTFGLKDFEDLNKIFSLEKRGYVYTRGGNPSVNLLERRLAALENGADAVCFSSGMGAISSVLLSNLKAGDHIIAHETLYGSAHSFIEHLLTRYGINVSFCDLRNYEKLEESFQENTKVIYFETPSNPMLELIDIARVSRIAHRYEVKVVVDNTFLSPYFQNPLDLGADVVIHSLTKYINGHGDIVGGCAISKDQSYIDYLKFAFMCEIGSPLDANSAFLVLRGLKTLAIRMEEHQRSALKIAQFLESHENVTKVLYPGLDSFPQKDIRSKQMKGDGAIISFEVKGTIQDAYKVIESVQIPILAVSLGDCDSLIEHPLSMTHRSYLEDKGSETYKKLEKLIRISVGLEDTDDLIEDLANALNKI